VGQAFLPVLFFRRNHHDAKAAHAHRSVRHHGFFHYRRRAAAIPAWKPLFNGKDLAGWKHVGPGSMTVEDGLIRTHGGMGLLYWTGGKLSNCRIRVVFKMRDHNDNSGIFIRIPIEPREEWMPVHYGYEVQIDNEPEKSNEDDYHITGTLYSLTKPLAKPGKPGPEWNTMVITLDGPHTIVELNGVKVTDYTEGQPVPSANSISSRSTAHAPTRATSAFRITAKTTSSFSKKSASSRCIRIPLL